MTGFLINGILPRGGYLLGNCAVNPTHDHYTCMRVANISSCLIYVWHMLDSRELNLLAHMNLKFVFVAASRSNWIGHITQCQQNYLFSTDIKPESVRVWTPHRHWRRDQQSFEGHEYDVYSVDSWNDIISHLYMRSLALETGIPCRDKKLHPTDFLWDTNTYPCHRNLLLATKSSYVSEWTSIAGFIYVSNLVPKQCS